MPARKTLLARALVALLGLSMTLSSTPTAALAEAVSSAGMVQTPGAASASASTPATPAGEDAASVAKANEASASNRPEAATQAQPATPEPAKTEPAKTEPAKDPDFEIASPDTTSATSVSVEPEESSSASAESAQTAPVQAQDPTVAAQEAARLAAAVKALEDDSASLSGWYPNPAYGRDTNIVSMLSAKLADLGYGDVAASLASVETGASDPKQQGGIAPDGTITYFFLSPADKTGYTDYSVLRQFTPTYTLSLGEARATFTPGRTSTLAWDEDAVRAYLSEQLAAADLPASLASGTAAADVATETLPASLRANGMKVAEVSWASNDEDVAKIEQGYDSAIWDYVATVTYAHAAQDAPVTLTATARMAGFSGVPDATVTSDFKLTVAADPGALEAEKAELQAKIDAGFVPENLKAFGTGDAVDLANITGDLQLPRPSKLGVDGKYYKVEYSSPSSAIAVNGYHAIVTRGLEEDGPATTKITVTVTKKDNPAVTATASLDVTIAPIPEADIDAAVSFMDQVKADFQNALLGGNESAEKVTQSLRTFQEAVPGADGSISYARSATGVTETGVQLVDLPGYDPMAGTGWRTLRSSDPSVIADETLRVTRPEADQLVTVTGSLSYVPYVALAKAHPNNAKLQSLVNQEVSATYRVSGTKDNSVPQVSATMEVVGPDAFGADQVWALEDSTVAWGSTAADLTEQVLDGAGLGHDSGSGAYGYYLNTITSPDGRTLGWDAASGKYWQLFVNGRASDVGAGSVKIQAGDKVVWYYSAFGASPDAIGKAQVTVTASVTGPNAAGVDSAWVRRTELTVPADATAADVTERLLTGAGLAHESGTTSYGYYLNTITSPDGRTLGYDAATGKFWQLFVDGTASDVGASSVRLAPGTRIDWYYSAWNVELPKNDVEVNPDAPRPSYEAVWPGYGVGGTGGLVVKDAPTATEGGTLAWAQKLGSNMGAGLYASDPIIVNGNLYLAVGDTLEVRSASTGALLASAKLATTVDSVARMVYANGVVVVPLHGGRLQALTADALATVWVTDDLSVDADHAQQSLSTLTVADGYVYYGTTLGDGSQGFLTCVSLANGAVRWQRAKDAGYYWSGAARVGSYLAVADGSGTVRALDPATGVEAGSLSLGGLVRSSVVADGSTLYVVTRDDGTLHRLSLAADGSLRETGAVAFADYSTSTPALAGGKAYVGGSAGEGTGVLAVIDLQSMRVERRVTSLSNGFALPGEVKSTPTVSVQKGGTYVYFTCNVDANGGSFLYRLGDSHASVLLSPSGEQAGYSMSSLVVGADGALCFVNDAGYLFRVGPGKKVADPEPGTPGTNPGNPGNPSRPTGPSNQGKPGGQPGADGDKGGSDAQPGSGNDGADGAGGDPDRDGGLSGVNLSLRSNVSGGAGAGSSDGTQDARVSTVGDASGEAAADASSAGSGSSAPGQDATRAAGDASAAADTSDIRALPAWPFVGMGIGAVALACALFAIVRERGGRHGR